MARQKIHISRLNIEIPRNMETHAKSLGESIGRDVLESIAEATRGRAGISRIDEVSVERVRAGGGAVDLRTRAASAVAAAVNKKIGGGK